MGSACVLAARSSEKWTFGVAGFVAASASVFGFVVILSKPARLSTGELGTNVLQERSSFRREARLIYLFIAEIMCGRCDVDGAAAKATCQATVSPCCQGARTPQ